MKRITCDSCNNEINTESVISISHTFGYGSQRDGDQIEIDLCEDCFDKLERNINLVKSFQ